MRGDRRSVAATSDRNRLSHRMRASDTPSKRMSVPCAVARCRDCRAARGSSRPLAVAAAPSADSRLRSSAVTANRRSRRRGRCGHRAPGGCGRDRHERCWKVQVSPACVSLPPPLAARPRSRPLRPSRVRLIGSPALNPRPPTSRPKSTLPGRSGRSGAGSMPVACPLTSQRCSGAQVTSPCTSAWPRKISSCARLNSTPSLPNFPLTSAGTGASPG